MSLLTERQSAHLPRSRFEVTGLQTWKLGARPFLPTNVVTMARSSKNGWANSPDRALLISDLTSGRIPLQSCKGFMPRDAHRFRPEYQAIRYDLFCSRLRSLQKTIALQKRTGSDDAASLSRDRLIYPKNARNVNGALRWEGSQAEKSLKLDVSNSRHVELLPSQLWETREEYKAFTKKAFASHLDQEKRRRKFHNYMASKAKAKAKQTSTPGTQAELTHGGH
jgi:hypothetical protein